MSAPANDTIRLYGRAILRGTVRVVTGMRIGGSEQGLTIGGVDNAVVRDPLTKRPYIPGSSLRGKLRALSERFYGLPLTWNIADARIHVCDRQHQDDYASCPVCPIFGVPSELAHARPARLIVRDVMLSDESAAELDRAQTDLPYTEVKTEIALDRITAKANPRQMERVPAGACFSPFELVYNVYEWEDLEPGRFGTVVTALGLLEDDYLGGLGARGSGQVRFESLTVTAKGRAAYEGTLAAEELPHRSFSTVGELAAATDLREWLQEQLLMVE